MRLFLHHVLLFLLPLTSPLVCYHCYTFLTNSTSISDYLPPLLHDVNSDTCNQGNTITCTAQQTCIYANLQLIYGSERAEVITMGCAGVTSNLNCRDLENTYYHPFFDLEDCEMDRCSVDKCNGGGVQMLSGAVGMVIGPVVMLVAVLSW